MNKIVLFFVFIASVYASQSLVQISVVSPKQETMSIYVDVQGSVEEREPHMITAPYDGVLHVKVSNTQMVKKGETIAFIENPEMRNKLTLSNKEVSLLDEQYKIEQQRERNSAEMLKMGLISNNDYLAEQTILNDKKIAYLNRFSEQSTLHKQFMKSSIKAPISGYISDMLSDGNAVSYGSSICKILGGKQIMRLYVPSFYIASLHVKQKLHFQAGANSVDAVITQIVPKATNNLVEVIASATSQLPIGLNIQAKIALSKIQGWVVPKESIVLVQNRPALYLIQNNIAHLHFVNIQKDLVNKVLITDDLKKDDKIAYENTYMLDEDVKVEITK